MRRALLLLLLPITPADLEGQEITGAEYNAYCTLGPVRACASANLLLTRFEDTSFSLEVRWRNMQGSSWGHDGTGGSFFDGLTITVATGYAVGGRDPSDFRGGYTGWLPEGSLREVQTGAGFFDQVGFSVQADRITHLYAGAVVPTIQGCDVTMPVGEYVQFLSIYSMCSKDSFDGWIVYRIDGNYSRSFTAEDVQFTWGLGHTSEGMGVSNGLIGEFRCNPTNPALCAQVVPEPSTWILLGTGLLGVGLFHRRRRTPVD